MEGTQSALLSPALSFVLNTRPQTECDTAAAEPPDVLSSTFSSGGLKKLCYPHYGLDPSTRCTVFRRSLNDVYMLSSRDRRYALKVYQSEWRTPAAILTELDAIRYLAGKGIDLVQPIARLDGKWITEMPAPEGRRSAVLFPWVGSETARWTDPSHAAQLGRLIAQMHTASDEIPSNGTRPQMTIHYLMEESLVRIRQTLEGAPELSERCESVVRRTRARLQRIKTPLADWGFCHNDLFINNAHIDAGRLVLLDFDWCGYGWRIFELASFRWASRLYNAEKIAWQPFIDEYLQIRPAAARCLEYLTIFMILRQLWTTAHFIRAAAIAGESLLANGRLEDLISQCERIEADPDLN